MNATHFECRPSPPKITRSDAAGVTPGKDVQPPRPPPAQRRPMASVSAPGLYTCFSAGSLDQAQSSNLVQAQKQPHRAPPHQQGQAVSRQPQNPPQSLSPNHPQNIRATVRSEPGSLSQQCDRQPQNLPSDGASSTDSSNTADHDPPVGFFTARAAESVQSVSGRLIKAPAFDPHLESPSIRKTAGVDHTKTKPVGRELIGAAPMPAPPFRSNFGNPQADKTRRVGMPGGAASPLQNRGSYKPPQMKRPAEGNLVQ
jgi:DNA repair and recombination protein RAD52